MARIKCLSNYLSDIADALRDRFGSISEIAAQDFDKMIYDLDEYDDSPDYVLFMDYDGTIIYRYTKTAFLALTAWPALPNRSSEGLVDGTWNWTDLSVAQQYVKDTGHLIIGPLYNTDDGAIHIHTNITNASYKTPIIALHINRSNLYTSTINNPDYYGNLIIDWGDGSPVETVNYKTTDNPPNGSSSSVDPDEYSHTYASTGSYIVKVKYDLCRPQDLFSCTVSLHSRFYGGGLAATDEVNNIYQSYVTRIDFPLIPARTASGPSYDYSLYPYLIGAVSDGRILSVYPNLQYVNLGSFNYTNKSLAATNKATFADCPKLKFIVTNLVGGSDQQRFTNDSELIGVSLCQKFADYSFYYFKGNTFVNCPKIDYICFPKTQYGSQYSLCSNSGPFTHMWIPKTWTYLELSDFASCTMTEVILPDNITTIRGSFRNCDNLSYVRLPKYLTTISSSSFYQCNSLTKIRMPASIQSIDGFAFAYCDNLELMDCRACVSVPALTGDAIDIGNGDTQIIVPDNLYEEWISTTGWSRVADQIVKESDWDAL